MCVICAAIFEVSYLTFFGLDISEIPITISDFAKIALRLCPLSLTIPVVLPILHFVEKFYEVYEGYLKHRNATDLRRYLLRVSVCILFVAAIIIATIFYVIICSLALFDKGEANALVPAGGVLAFFLAFGMLIRLRIKPKRKLSLAHLVMFGSLAGIFAAAGNTMANLDLVMSSPAHLIIDGIGAEKVRVVGVYEKGMLVASGAQLSFIKLDTISRINYDEVSGPVCYPLVNLPKHLPAKPATLCDINPKKQASASN